MNEVTILNRTPKKTESLPGRIYMCDGEPYIIARVEGSNLLLVSLISGNRWQKAMSVKEMKRFLDDNGWEQLQQNSAIQIRVGEQ